MNKELQGWSDEIRIRELEKEVKVLRLALMYHGETCKANGELKEENARLREALGFYAENKNWEQRDIGSRVIAAIDPVDHWEYVDKWGDIFWIGGKRANEALEREE